MRQTVTNITGMLPPKYFSVKISSSNDDLAQLMYTAMMTGYMFRNAQYRLDLQTSISGSLLEGEHRLKACKAQKHPRLQAHSALAVAKTEIEMDVEADFFCIRLLAAA